jgi:hypothetical protein
MRIAVCQYDIQWEDKEANKRRIRELVAGSPRKPEIDWLIFSEMTLSAFTMNTAISELTTEDNAFFSALAADNGFNITYGGVERGYNNIITLDRKGRRVNTHAKIHLYSFGEEDKYYKAGSTLDAFEMEGLRVVPAYRRPAFLPFWSMAIRRPVGVIAACRPAEGPLEELLYTPFGEQCYCVGVNRTAARAHRNLRDSSATIHGKGCRGRGDIGRIFVGICPWILNSWQRPGTFTFP